MKLVTFMSDSQSVSHVVAICGVAMYSVHALLRLVQTLHDGHCRLRLTEGR